MTPILSASALAVLLLLHFPLPAAAFQQGPGGVKGCVECHNLTKEDAGKVLRKVADNVVAVVPGPIPGIWEVDVGRNGKIYPLYLDYSLKYLFNGEYFRMADMANLTEQRYGALNRVNVASIPVKDAIRVGSAAAKKTVIVLTDPTCPYCIKLHGEIRKAVAKNPDVAFLVMPYPRSKQDKATYLKCVALVCSKSVKLLEDAYAGKELPPATCTTDAVDETIRLAERLRIRGTPTMILPDGTLVSGLREADVLLTMLK